MTKEQAIQFLENLAQNAYKQGTVGITPEAFEVFTQAIETLKKCDEKCKKVEKK